MSEVRGSNPWVMGAGAAVLLVVLLPLWMEFSEINNMVWNTFLAVFLIAISVGAFLLQRYFAAHIDEVGEARFNSDGSKKTDG